MTNRQTWSPLAAGEVLGGWGGEQSVMLGMSHTILVAGHE
jgi:hypothetical protein